MGRGTVVIWTKLNPSIALSITGIEEARRIYLKGDGTEPYGLLVHPRNQFRAEEIVRGGQVMVTALIAFPSDQWALYGPQGFIWSGEV